MTTKYFALLTRLGADKLANAAALGTKLDITHMAIGDGGGTLPTPDTAQTKLVNERRRAAINVLSVDPKNTHQIIAEQVIPESEGGWWIREIGLFDKDGILIAVGNCAETYKPQLQEGSGRTQTLRMVLIVSHTDAVTLKIDPSVVLATREYADALVKKAMVEHEKSRRHPDATLKEKGFVILSSAVDSNSETHSATPKAVKSAYDLANAANDNANGRLEKARNGADIPDKIAFMSNVGAYPQTGGKISGDVICQRLTLEAAVPYLAGFDLRGERQFFCGRAGDGPLYLKNDTTGAMLKITDDFQFNGVVTAPGMTVKSDIPYIAGFDLRGERQFFCGRAGDGPLYFKNDTTDTTLKITDVFHFNTQVIPADYANFDQRYQIYGEIRLFPFRPHELPSGWYHCNGDKHPIHSVLGKALTQLSGSYKSDFRISVDNNAINLPNFYSGGRGLFLRPSTTTGQIVPDTFRAHSHPEVVSSIDSGRIVNYGENAAVAWFRATAARYPGNSRTEGVTGGVETAPMHIGMTPAIFLGV
ncbi:phage tail protein [Xenorhabdus nematophila]|uniref:phage tail protein n=1 Tax=Xenorhabdus nematophila TaxID=628 RepID=UPI0039ED149B